jgi:GH15 family glucan-1,4-alpha-glucosidase
MHEKPGNVVEEARRRALEILFECVTPYGFRASAQHAGYPQIWARDSVLTFLGAIASQEEQLIQTGRNSLEILGAHQSPLGLIPLNVNPDTGVVSTENAGAVDANLYFILGHYLHYKVTGSLEFLNKSWKRVKCAMNWLLYQDMNECGLLEIPEAGNWMDLFSVRYNTLYDNVLYYAASLAYQELAANLPPEECVLPVPVRPDNIHERLNLLFWIDRCWVAEHFAEQLEKLKAIRLEWFMLYHNIGTISSRPFYLPWVAFREYGDYCDSFGNLLAILTGIADGHRAEHILRYMRQVGMDRPYPTKAIHPPIYPGESSWREYFRIRNLNLPHQYHNGGIWPMVGGLHVAALVRRNWSQEADVLLHSLAEANRQGIEAEWEFNEWLHGESGRPMGYSRQAWSAAAYLYAEHTVRTGALPLFDDLLAAKPDRLRLAEQNEIIIHPGGGPVPNP